MRELKLPSLAGRLTGGSYVRCSFLFFSVSPLPLFHFIYLSTRPSRLKPVHHVHHSSIVPPPPSITAFVFFTTVIVAAAMTKQYCETKKHCDHKSHCACHMKKKPFRLIFYGILALIIIVLSIALVIWVVLRPTHPRFVLQDAAISQFNVTAGAFLSTTLQISLLSRNANDRIGVYYDRLDTYAAYRNQQVTLAARLPRNFQGHKEITIWSPVLAGYEVHIPPSVAFAIQQDQNAGSIVLNIKGDGKVRFKVGSWTSGQYRININCAAYFRFGGGCGSVLNSGCGVVKLQQAVGCNVDL